MSTILLETTDLVKKMPDYQLPNDEFKILGYNAVNLSEFGSIQT